MDVPEQGQLAEVRGRHFVVDDVAQHSRGTSVLHRVTLDCLDDDAVGHRMDVIWQREVNAQVFDTSRLPVPAAWDSPARFAAFCDAIRWSTGSFVEGPELQAPFRGAIEIDDYQLLPVARALQMPRVSLLIADDVGLGKTIEAGLVMQELIARRQVRKVLIVCPASLQQQWRDEMEDKFHLEFRIIDRDSLEQLRREYGVHINPWSSFPRLITSMDYIKRAQPLQTFRDSLQQQAHSALRDWHLLIVDEVHNCAPAGRQQHVRDSDRTRMLNELSPHFEHRLFLTATPHNGYTESFTALLEMLDPLRFSRGTHFDRGARDLVMIRRLKDDIRAPLGGRKFAKREVEALPITVRDTTAQDLLDRYVRSRMDRATEKDRFAVRFALTLLKKRFLSSPLAFWCSLQTHTRVAGTTGEAADPGLVERMRERVNEDWDDDEEKAQHEDTALQEASRFFAQLTPDERTWLRDLTRIAEPAAGKPDEKAQALVAWIEEQLLRDGQWGDERLIVFTEYRDTLEYLQTLLSDRGWGDRLLTLYGGMPSDRREQVKEAFQEAPSETLVRILLGTDAASEGLNLQNHCRNVIHYEVPWNPNRMEQRNGRIDRHGQRAPVVRCYHFHYTNNADQQFLTVVVEKVKTQRADLGAVGDVIAEEVERAMVRLSDRIADPAERRQRQEEELRSEIRANEEAAQLRGRLLTAQREMCLYPQNLAQVLHEALRLLGHPGLRLVEHGDLAGCAYDLTDLPPAWQDCRRYLRSAKGNRLRVVFDHDVAKDRRDVVLLDLGHPLMQRAIAVFRGCLWEQPLGRVEQLHRCTYRLLPHRLLPKPAIVAWARLVATSTAGEKLHEALLRVGAWIQAEHLAAIEDDLLDQLLQETDFAFTAIPIELGDRLRALFPSHQAQLNALLSELEARERERLKALLSQEAASVSTQIRDLIRERIAEITKRIRDAEKQLEAAQRMLDIDVDEVGQRRDDVVWLRRRLDRLLQDRDTEPRAAEARYKLKALRVFPLGLIYLIPESMLQGGSE